jgi:hypothetical protein
MSSTEKKTPARRRPAATDRSGNGTSARPRATRAPRTATPLASPFAPSHEDIQRRAYEIFLTTGAQPGHDLEHWLQAERELVRRV